MFVDEGDFATMKTSWYWYLWDAAVQMYLIIIA